MTLPLLMLFSLLSPHLNATEPDYSTIQKMHSSSLNSTHTSAPQRLIVTFAHSEASADGIRNAQQASKIMGEFQSRTGETLTMLRQHVLPNRYIYGVRQDKTKAQLASIIKNVESLPDVLSVEEDILLQHTFTPDDPRYNEQWSYYEASGGIQANSAWDQSTGQNTTVAVLDTGYTDHPDLVDSISPGFDFISNSFVANDGGGRDADAHDPGDWLEPGECGYPGFKRSSWHGTHVSGTIAATTHNSIGVSGIAYNTRIVPVRVLGKCGGYLSDIADAIVWASGGRVSGAPTNRNPANVISMSLGGSGRCSPTIQAAINQAISNGSSIIAAAGNDRGDASNTQPANCTGVISVAASNRQGKLSYYSNFGSVTLTAPGGETNRSIGEGILSTLNTGARVPSQDSYAFYQGTSMATPHVAGTVALIYQLAPNLTPSEMEQVLTSTARVPFGSCSVCGAGILNAAAAVASVQNVNQAPMANFTFSNDGMTLLFNDTSQDNDGSIVEWYWRFGDGETSSSQTPRHTYNAAGDYKVKLTVTDNDGATHTKTKKVSAVSGASSDITLSHQWAKLSKTGYLRVNLVWANATSEKVDIYLNGKRVQRTKNDGSQTNKQSKQKGTIFTYKVCEKKTDLCSNNHKVAFSPR